MIETLQTTVKQLQQIPSNDEDERFEILVTVRMLQRYIKEQNINKTYKDNDYIFLMEIK